MRRRRRRKRRRRMTTTTTRGRRRRRRVCNVSRGIVLSTGNSLASSSFWLDTHASVSSGHELRISSPASPTTPTQSTQFPTCGSPAARD